MSNSLRRNNSRSNRTTLKSLIAVVVTLFFLSAPDIARASNDKHFDDQCLVSAIYHESRGESLEGQRAVYDVIMHRARVLKKSVCEVVKAPKQFSWYPNKPILAYNGKLKEMLTKVKEHRRILKDESYRWFFSGEKIPYWAVNMACHKLGGHRFCKTKEKKRSDYSRGQVRH